MLRHEGLNLLQGSLLPVPEPHLYRVPAAEWQPRLIGFVQRAGVAFTVGAAAAWLRYRGYVRFQSDLAELENMRAFWQAAALPGLVRYDSEDRILPLRHYAWAVMIRITDPLENRKTRQQSVTLGNARCGTSAEQPGKKRNKHKPCVPRPAEIEW